MVMVTIALVMAVIVTNIYAKKESPERAPQWCVDIVQHLYPAYFNFKNETGSRRVTKANRKWRNGSSTATCNDQLLRTFPTTSAAATTGNWATQEPEVVIETGNEIQQEAQDPSLNEGKSSMEVMNAGSGYQSSYNTSEDYKPEVNEVIVDCKRLPDKHDRRRFEVEWKLIAKFTDRVFFWIFLLLSIIVQAVLFLQMVPKPSGK